jgi:hypothetical protein
MKSIVVWLLFTSATLAADPAVEGPKVIAEAFGKLSAALAESVSKNGAAAALSVCSEKAPQIAKEVAEAHGVKLRRATEKPRNPKSVADETETAVLTAFVEALAKKEAAKPQIVSNADGSQTFFAPIVMGNPLCLQCHGEVGKDVTPETLTAIQKLYPDDKATGYKLGDLRGLWRINFPPTP